MEIVIHARMKEYCWEITIDGLRVTEITAGELLLALSSRNFLLENYHFSTIKKLTSENCKINVREMGSTEKLLLTNYHRGITTWAEDLYRELLL
jgi:hypothetical protein